MRKINAYIAGALIIALVLHGLSASYLLVGIGRSGLPLLAVLSLVLLAVRAVLSCILTGRSLVLMKKGGGPYYVWQNRLFWLRRLSGLLILALIWFHFSLFGQRDGDTYVIAEFTGGKLLFHLVFAAAVAVHVLSNIRPLAVTLGWRRVTERTRDIVFVLSVFFLAMVLMAVIYYVRGGPSL